MMEMATKTCRDKHLYDMKKINHGHVTLFSYYKVITQNIKKRKNPRAAHVTSMALTTVKRTVVCKKNLFKRNASNEFHRLLQTQFSGIATKEKTVIDQMNL